jgi:hypothetical protein
MPTTTYLRFTIDEQTLLITEFLSCMNIKEEDVHEQRLVSAKDRWNTYELDINRTLTAEELFDELGGVYVLKNVYLNGVLLEGYEYDDTQSVQETVESLMLTDTDTEVSSQTGDGGHDDEMETLYRLLQKTKIYVGDEKTGKVVECSCYSPTHGGVLFQGTF